MQFTKFSELGYKGFGIVFNGSKVQLVGEPCVLNSITAPILEYLHAIIIAGKLMGRCCITRCVSPMYTALPPPPLDEPQVLDKSQVNYFPTGEYIIKCTAMVESS